MGQRMLMAIVQRVIALNRQQMRAPGLQPGIPADPDAVFRKPVIGRHEIIAKIGRVGGVINRSAGIDLGDQHIIARNRGVKQVQLGAQFRRRGHIPCAHPACIKMRRPDQIIAHTAPDVIQRRSTVDNRSIQRQKIAVIAPAADQNLALGTRLHQIGQRDHMVGVKLGKAGDGIGRVCTIGFDAVTVSCGFVHQIPAIDRVFHRAMPIHPRHHLGPGPGHIRVICPQRRISRCIRQRPPSGIADANVLRITTAIGDGQLIPGRSGSGQKPLHLRIKGAIGVEGIFVEQHAQIVHQRQALVDRRNKTFRIAVHCYGDHLGHVLPCFARAICSGDRDIDHLYSAGV